ncbi:unnamed protein product, partial [marine sediment metagenome]
CGEKKWIIDNQGIICHKCGNKYALVGRDMQNGKWHDLFISPENFAEQRKFVRKLENEEIQNLLSDS